MKLWRCEVCNHVFEGDAPPDKCPVCNVGPERFVEEIPKEHKPGSNLKKATRKMSYGLYVISSRKGEKLNGQVANAAFQVTTNPTTIAISVNKENLTKECIDESGYFALNILGTDNMRMVRRFGFRSGREFDKFKNMNFGLTPNNMPYLKDAAGWIECKVIPDKTINIGTHTIYIADVLDGDGRDDAPETMTYAYYRKNK
ncbi:flavin reductase [Clostridia bacterium]|nr:flavin reductase [Clostridia bacterium]